MRDIAMKALGTFCEFKYGRSLPAKNRQSGEIPVYGSNGIVGWHDEPLTCGPTIVIGRKGSAGALQYSETPCYPIDTTYYVDSSCTTVDLKWLFYMLQKLGLSALSKHSAVPGLNRNDAYVKELAVPTINQQKKIATVLDTAHELLCHRQQSLELTERLIESIFIEMFGDPIKNPKGWPVHPLSALAEKFSDGPFGSNLKTEHYTNNGIRVWRLQDIGIGSLKNGGPAYISLEHYASLPKHHCSPGDVIVGTLGDPNLRAIIIPDDIPKSLNKADCVQIRTKKDIALSEYLCWLLNMPGTLALAQRLILGETRARISMGRLKTLSVPLPPIELQQKFSRKISQIKIIKTAMEERKPELENLFFSIQNKAFRRDLNLNRVVLTSDNLVPISKVQKNTVQIEETELPRAFLRTSANVEKQLKKLDAKINNGETIPWSAEYFRHRILGIQVTPFSFDELMHKAESVFDEPPPYEEIKEMILSLLSQHENDAHLKQWFDEGRREIVLRPIS